MQLIKHSIATLILPATLFAALPANADISAGDLIVRLGAVNVNPDTDSSSLNAGNTPVTLGGATTQVEVADNTQLGITLSYMLTDNIGLGLLAATPFKHDIHVEGGLNNAGLDTVVETRHLPPTLTAQYHFTIGERVKPYLGVGLNYTQFFDERPTPALEAAAGSTRVNLDDSWGLALEAGLDVEIADSWYANLHVWHLDIDTEAELSTSNLGTLNVSADLDPTVFMLGVGKRF